MPAGDEGDGERATTMKLERGAVVALPASGNEFPLA